MTPSKPDASINTTHVLHIASGDLWAGAEVMLYTLAKAQNNEPTIQVSVVVLNFGMLEQKLRDLGISVYILDETKLNSFQILRKLNKIVGKLKPDVIHTHRNKENILGSIVAWLNHHTPSLRTLHGAPEHPPGIYNFPKRIILFLGWLTGRFYQRYIIVVSTDLSKKIEGSFPDTKIKVIENGIDFDSLTHKISLSSTNNTEGNYFKIGIAGRLTPVKRIDLFIDTAAYLTAHHPDLNISFHIYGNGPLYKTLETQIQSLSAENYIHLEGHCENLSLELQSLDALLMTSDHEGLPMVLLEAMCLRTPVISHAVGGITHLLDQGKYGVLVKNQTPEAFSEAIVNLLKNPENRQQISNLAQDHVKNNYSSKHVAKHYLEAYKQMLK